jgi:hypothetical protein
MSIGAAVYWIIIIPREQGRLRDGKGRRTKSARAGVARGYVGGMYYFLLRSVVPSKVPSSHRHCHQQNRFLTWLL